jgi:hypothetical protein
MRTAPEISRGGAEEKGSDVGNASCSNPQRPAQADIDRKPDCLLRQYRNARDELNAGLALLERAINLREMLEFGLDLDDVAAEVAAFNRAANAHKAKRRMRS